MELPVKKRHCVPKMHTRAKMKIVASDRARRENVLWHILFFLIRFKLRTEFVKYAIMKFTITAGCGYSSLLYAVQHEHAFTAERSFHDNYQNDCYQSLL